MPNIPSGFNKSVPKNLLLIEYRSAVKLFLLIRLEQLFRALHEISSRKNTAMLWIDDDQAQTAWLTLECQPLFTLAGTIHGQALLYRGATLGSWLPTNVAVAKHLGKYELEFSKVFVNLANGALTAVNDEAFVPALQNNSVVFRLSGQYLCTDSVANIVSKVNRLLAEGIQFAINGFGIGVDGLLRKYCLAEISYVKIDGAFLHTCHECNDEAAVLRYLVKTWQRRAGRCEQDA